MAQTRVRERMAPGVAGLLFDTADHHTVTRTNSDPEAKQITTLSVDSASDDTTYTVRIDGIEVTFTSDGSATQTEIKDGLVSAINDEPLVSGTVVAESASSTSLTVTALEPGQSFDLTESEADLSTTATQTAAEADPIPFGRAVIRDSIAARDDGQLAKLADASKLTAQVTVVDVTDSSGDTYSVDVTVDGTTYSSEFESSGGGATALVDALVTDLNNALPADTVVAANESDQLELTAETAGRPFDVSIQATDASNISIASDNSDGTTDINKALEGVAVWTTDQPYPDDGDGPSQVEPNSTFTCLDTGRVWVATEADVTAADADVYVRLSANGSLDELGGFRPDNDTGCVRLKDATWAFKEDADLAVLELG